MIIKAAIRVVLPQAKKFQGLQTRNQEETRKDFFSLQKEQGPASILIVDFTLEL